MKTITPQNQSPISRFLADNHQGPKPESFPTWNEGDCVPIETVKLVAVIPSETSEEGLQRIMREAERQYRESHPHQP